MHAFLGLKSYKIEENLHKNSKHHILFTFKKGLMLIFLKQSISAAELIIAII